MFIIAVTAIISIFGDLFFSYIKRQNQIKDFSKLIPGHGGILDRIDSIIFAIIFYGSLTLIISIIYTICFPEYNSIFF
jgi:phosphatidate cytidylyltransferase